MRSPHNHSKASGRPRSIQPTESRSAVPLSPEEAAAVYGNNGATQLLMADLDRQLEDVGSAVVWKPSEKYPGYSLAQITETYTSLTWLVDYQPVEAGEAIFVMKP